MKLRIRLFLYLFLITIVPFTLGMMIVVRMTRDTFIHTSIRQLESIAALQKSRVHSAIKHELEVLELVSHAQTLDEKTVRDVRLSNPSIRSIELKDVDTPFTESRLELFKDSDNILRVRLTKVLAIDGQKPRRLELVLNADSFLEITEDYTGLGKTGETTLAMRNENGDALFINPLRFDPGAAMRRAISKGQTNVDIAIALKGEEHILNRADIIDYRGRRVVAVTRSIDALGWVLSSKMDYDEVYEPVRLLQKRIWSIVIGFYVLMLSACISTPLVSHFQSVRRKSRT